MVTRKELFAAVRSGAFVPFPYSPHFKSVDLKSILEEVIQALSEDSLSDLILYLAGHQQVLPAALTPREKLFYKALRQGAVTSK